jgi:hypothetical protein
MKPIDLDPEQKLELLRRLDPFGSWHSADERRLCLGCGKLIIGREINIGRSMGGVGPLRLKCPTEDCRSGPIEWVEPDRAESSDLQATRPTRSSSRSRKSKL